jgi:predicted dinucleotide-binding enzyme
VAVLGSGNIGGTLGAKWLAAGHPVVFGVRDPTSAQARAALEKAGADARTDTIANAIHAGEVVVITIPAGAVDEMLAHHGAALDGKIVVDATNRFGAPIVNHLEAVAAAAPRAVLYRAFNSLGWENFAEPAIDGEQVDLFYCGPDGHARPIVDRLIAEVGLRPIYVGGLETAPLVDSLGSLWMTLVWQQHKSRRMAFRLQGG